jgi:hypothetical protein
MNGNIFDVEGKSPTLTTNKGEGPKIGRMIGMRATDKGIMPFKEGGVDSPNTGQSLTRQQRREP